MEIYQREKGLSFLRRIAGTNTDRLGPWRQVEEAEEALYETWNSELGYQEELLSVEAAQRGQLSRGETLEGLVLVVNRIVGAVRNAGNSSNRRSNSKKRSQL